MRSAAEMGGGGGEGAPFVAQAPFPRNVYMGGGGAGMGCFVSNNFSPLLLFCSTGSFLPKGAGVEIWSS